MPDNRYEVGDVFPVQFAWKLPEGDYVRAVFEAEVLDLVLSADKYIVRLLRLIAGRQEDERGRLRPTDEVDQEYWGLVNQLAGNKVSLAFEVDDGRALQLRLTTLTGEHNFFRRFADAESVLREKGLSRKDSPPEVSLQ